MIIGPVKISHIRYFVCDNATHVRLFSMIENEVQNIINRLKRLFTSYLKRRRKCLSVRLSVSRIISYPKLNNGAF